ncbi:MAG: DegT/DnrJ/EryC1/StrS family aminotransferase, partial [Clostridia bacterium]|nr:DegT/DnrJ/EryC1/StrS family aminotransferase [Clostridia bacterium]
YRKIDGVDSDEIYRQVQLLSLHGQSKDALSKNKLGAWEYDIVAPYFKCNMTDIMAALGVAQLTRYDQMLARRREIVARYDQALRPLGVKTLDHYTAEHNSSGHLYLTHTPFITTAQRNEIITKMAEREIACNVHYKPLPLLSAYKNLGFDIKNYPNAYEFYQKEITLPLNTTLTDEQVDYVIENFVKIVKEYC